MDRTDRNSLNSLSCVELAAAIRERRTTCVAAMEAVLERASTVQPKLNCFLRVDADAALAAAHLADREIARGYVRGPLHGVPMAHKDMYYRRGVVSTCGSKILRDTPAAATAKVLEHLDAAGAIQFGVLNMAEFAMGPTGHNWHYGHCRNPWDPERVTGGSSSGSGASVAARANFAALGSDTGGSVRLPSAFCGLAGVRPTHGRVSVENILPLCPSLDTVGPLTRTVEDAALILEVIAPGFVSKLKKRIAGLRIGRPRQVFYEGCDSEIAAAMEASLEVFRRLGASVVDVDLPDFSQLSAAAAVLHAAEANPFHDEWFRTRPQDYSPQVRDRLEKGRPVLARDYLNAMHARAGHRRVLRGSVLEGGPGARPGGVVSDADDRRDRYPHRRGVRADAGKVRAAHAADQLPRAAGGVRQRGLHQGRHADRHAAHRCAVRRGDRATSGSRPPAR